MRKIIKKEINKLIRKYKTNDPFDLAGFLKIQVLFWDFPEEVNGLYQYEKREKFIYINFNLSSKRRIIVCAHELGHAILHSKLNSTFLKEYTFLNINKYEKEANLFAAELIIDDELLQEYPNLTLNQISTAEDLPIELLELKFKDLSIF